MSSAISYEWYRAHGNPRKIYKQNKETFEEDMNISISDVRYILNRHPNMFKNIDEVVKPLEEYRDNFLASYTFEVFSSPNHTNWVDSKMQAFNDLVLKVKSFLKLIELETNSRKSLSTLKTILDNVPNGCDNLKREINSIILEAKNFLEQVNEAKRSMDIEKLKDIYYKEAPSVWIEQELDKEKVQIANILLKDKFKQEQTKQKEIEIQKAKEEIENIKQEAKNYYEKLSKILPSEADKLKNLYEELSNTSDRFRIENILNEIKFRYAKYKPKYVVSEVLKEDIKKYLNDDIGQELKDKVKRFLEKELVDKNEYDDLVKSITENTLAKQNEKRLKEEKEQMSKILSEKLRALGYQTVKEDAIEKLKNGEIVDIQTPYGEDYVLRVKLDEKGNLAFKFVRFVEDENLSEYEKEKDKSIAKKWCSAQDELIELLRKEGIIIEAKNRVEPDQRFYYEKREKKDQMRRQAKEQGKNYCQKSL